MCTSVLFDEHRVARLSGEALAHNVSVIRRALGGKSLVAVIKADAYGHGSVDVAHRLRALGVERFAVATADEALTLRSAGIREALLVLGDVSLHAVEALARQDVAVVIHDREQGLALASEARRQGVCLPIEIKFDSGLTRLGFSTEEASLETSVHDVRRLCRNPAFVVRGAYSHFASAEHDAAFTAEQCRRTEAAIKATGLTFPYTHMGGSGGLGGDDDTFDALRVGLMLYGVRPCPDFMPSVALRPVMSVLGRVVKTMTLSQTSTIGYGGTATRPAGTRLAVVEIGYADGVLRALSNRGAFWIAGRRCPIVGVVSMDRSVVEWSDGDVKRGDWALYFGRDADTEVTADQVAREADTIPYELLCHIGPRVRRIWNDDFIH